MKNQFDKDYFYGKKKSNYSNYEKINFERQFKNLVHFIQNENISGIFLDVGCAFGSLTKLLSPYFKEMHGCDISKFAIKRARKLHAGIKFKIVDIDKGLPYPNESFDCITAIDVLEHTQFIENSLKNIISKLKKNGYLVISLPINNRITKSFKFLDKDKTHLHIPNESEIISLLSKMKMKIIDKKYFLPTPYSYKIYGIPVEIELYLRK